MVVEGSVLVKSRKAMAAALHWNGDPGPWGRGRHRDNCYALLCSRKGDIFATSSCPPRQCISASTSTRESFQEIRTTNRRTFLGRIARVCRLEHV